MGPRHSLEEKKLELELESQKQQNAHKEKMRQIENTENLRQIENIAKRVERNSELNTKRILLEHQRLMHKQEKVLTIVDKTFEKAEVKDTDHAILAAVILKSIQTGEPMDDRILELVIEKARNALPMEFKQNLRKVMEECPEDERDSKLSRDESIQEMLNLKKGIWMMD